MIGGRNNTNNNFSRSSINSHNNQRTIRPWLGLFGAPGCGTRPKQSKTSKPHSLNAIVKASQAKVLKDNPYSHDYEDQEVKVLTRTVRSKLNDPVKGVWFVYRIPHWVTVGYAISPQFYLEAH